MLIGADAPIVLESEVRSSHFEHAYDFYKPNLASPYPVVDGHFSNLCYLKSLDTCYRRYTTKFLAKVRFLMPLSENSVLNLTPHAQHRQEFDLDSADFTIFHAPYNKLVQKSVSRLLYNDFIRFPDRAEFKEANTKFASIPEAKSYDNRDLVKSFSILAKSRYFFLLIYRNL